MEHSYKILIADDEKEAATRLKLYLEKLSYFKEIFFCYNGKEALDYIVKFRPDIVFIDIEMPEMNGIEVLRNCQAPYPYFVFVTAYNQYAVDAFEENAVDYILKPYSEERIHQAVNRVIDRLEKDYLIKKSEDYKNLLFALSNPAQSREKSFIKRIAVKSIGKTSFIDVEDILFIEAADQYVNVFITNKKIVVRESMEKLDKTLDPDEFFRTHRSFIVNLSQVEAIENVDKHMSLVVLKNGEKVKLANNRKTYFKEKMGI